ncbi:hypothetical protein M9H77_28619 [Catharanthus roseus]|uniref:Uncharacterized protein n=1 Tax=Catharanthus roseus TaxID=4058 RepID=A0ACC0AGV1_CATRO|nr:hypothetical protein M9H77_28619 [Catharanthus roseus]
MKSLSRLGLGLSLVFGCLLLALFGELYYLLWWKRRRITTNRGLENGTKREFFCWKKSSSLTSTTQVHEPQVHQHLPHEDSNSNKDFWYKPFGTEDQDGTILDEELMRVQNIGGPPRFLFTIKEETKEDLESEDGKSTRKGSRSKSLGDLFHILETPYLTPLASPPYFTPPLTPIRRTTTSSSPPPNFQFLRDAEDKLNRRRIFTEETVDLEKGSFFTFLVGKNREEEDVDVLQCIPNSSKVLPLAASPPTTTKTTSK